MSALLQKSWLFVYLLVISADFGYWFASEDASYREGDKAATTWTLVSQPGAGIDGAPDTDDGDGYYFIPPSHPQVEPPALVFHSFSVSPLAPARYELQPRTSQGPPVLTV